MSAPLLDVRGIDVFYGDVQVLWDLSFSVGRGEIVALIGANGAGKSTTLKTVSGILRPKRGEIRFQAESLAAVEPWHLVERGIVHVPEARRLFVEMSVEENLDMGALRGEARSAASRRRRRSSRSSRGSGSAAASPRGRSPKAQVELGMSVQEITPEMARQLRLREAGGVIVSQVESGSPAEEAGVQRGDIIQEINGQPISKLRDYQSAIGKVKKDEMIRLLVKRGERNLYLAFRSNK